MGLANPWLLFGLAALAVPVLVHLVLREERSGRTFPSLMFVRRIPFEIKRRRKLRDRALLALRCLALAALVLAFAGPYLDEHLVPGSDARPPRDVVLLLDRSYSMSQPQRWERAVAEIRERIDGLAAGERAALVAFDDTARVAAGLTADRAALRGALAEVEPGDGATGLAAAFGAAGEVLARDRTGRQSVVLVSDLQRSALDGGGMLVLDEAVALEIVPVSGAVGANAAVVDVRRAAHGDDGVGDSLAVRVRNTGDAPLRDATVVLEVDGRNVDRRQLNLAPGAERTLDFPVVLAGDRPTRVTVHTGPDALAADDRYHAVLAPRRPLVAGLIEADGPRAQESVFLEEALRLARDPAIEIRRLPAAGIDESLGPVDVVIVDDVALPSAAARAVAAFVDRGGGLLAFAGPAAATPSEAGLPGPAFGPVDTRDGAGERVEVAARDHPLWSVPGLDGGTPLAGVRVTGIRRLSPAPADRVLARLGDGAPLLVEHSRGAGRALVLATTADPRWGSLALAPGFVPLVHAAVIHLAGASRWRSAYFAGEVVDLPRHAGGLPAQADWRAYLANGGAVVVEDPAGRASRLRTDGGNLFTAALPGIHEAHRADGRGAALPFAVNTDRAESMLAAATPAEVESRIARREARDGAARLKSDAGENAGPGSMFPWLLALAGLVLMLEGALANRIGRQRGEAAT